MGFGVVVINENRRPGFDGRRLASVRVQFAERVHLCLNEDVILYQSKSRLYGAGYFAVAQLLDADVSIENSGNLSLVFGKPTYFKEPIALQNNGVIIETHLRNDKGDLHGRRAAEDFRAILDTEFREIVAGGYFLQEPGEHNSGGLEDVEERLRLRVAQESWLRSVRIRTTALPVYDFKCAITKQSLPSLDGLRSGLHVCHAKSVASGGPDTSSNLVVFCPDFHTRYDQGTIDILDDYTWMPIGKHHDEIVANWSGPRKLFVPENPEFRLDAKFLAAHRKEIAARLAS